MSICFICKKCHNIENIYSCNDIVTIIVNNLVNYNKEYYLNILNKYKKLIKLKIFIKKNKCEYCKKIFSSDINYTNHIKNKICQKNKEYICENCGKEFSEKKNLEYHKFRLVCNKNINNNSNNNITNNNIINNNIKTQNNQNIIQINLNNSNYIEKVVEMIPFKNVKYNITPEKYLEYAKFPERAIKSFVKDEHFNPNKPERMNILNTNSRSNKVQILDRDDDDEIRWMIKTKSDINELLYDRVVNHLYVAKNILEANGIFLDARTEQKLNDKINEYETDNRSKREQIDIISDLTYNYRDIIDSNKKINKLLLQN